MTENLSNGHGDFCRSKGDRLSETSDMEFDTSGSHVGGEVGCGPLGGDRTALHHDPEDNNRQSESTLEC
jgi:hypothetical protein